MSNLRAIAWFCVMASGATLAVSGSPVPLDIVTVVGEWSQSTDGGTTVVTSAPGKWDGKSGPDLATVARTLFEQPSPAFAANSAPATAYPLAVVRSVSGFDHGTLEVQFKLIAGPTDQTAGIAFGIGPAADYLYVRYNTKDGDVAVWEFVDGKRRVLVHGTQHAQLPLNTWHRLSVQVSKDTISAAAIGSSGTRLSVAHRLEQPVAGRVGFWTKRDATSAFKNLQILK
jgi:hypothetical protein